MNTSKPPHVKRKLTPFLCQEMLYDYRRGRLDSERKYAIDTYIQENLEAKKELEALDYGLEYCNRLSKTRVSEALIAEYKLRQSGWKDIGTWLAFWRWPQPWPWIVEGVIVVALLVVVIDKLPWSEFSRLQFRNEQPVVLLDVPTGEVVGAEMVAPEQGEPPGGLEAEETTRQSVNLAIAEKPQLKEMEPITERSASQLEDNNSLQGKPRVEKPIPPQGLLYRVSMSLDNLDFVGPEISRDINDLGGKKAGQVQLGWTKGEGRYYHFTLPEKNEKKLLQTLQAYGPVQISKHPHPRVMPEGKLRFILWVERKKD